MCGLLCFLFLSQGLPFPDQEFNAADVVVRYAVTELGFAFEDIILYAWSIGNPASLFSFFSLSLSLSRFGSVIILCLLQFSFALSGGYCASCIAMSYPDVGAVVGRSLLHVCC